MPQDLQVKRQRRLFGADHIQLFSAGPAQLLAGSIGLAVAVGIAYWLAAQLSLALQTKPDGVAVFWPAAGVAVGLLIALGPSARLPVAAGAIAGTIVANLLSDRNLSGSMVFALCNAAEAVLVAELIERYYRSEFNLGRLHHVLGLVAAAVIGTAISGLGGTIGFKLFHSSTASILTTWQHWVTSDALGIITVAPLMIGLASAVRKPMPKNELIEGVVALAALAVMSGLVILVPREPWTTVVPVALLFPLLLWLAARCHPVFASAAAFIVALAIVWTTTFGIGQFGDPSVSIEDRIVAAQAGILFAGLCAVVLAALFAERREHETALIDSEARLQKALTVGAITVFEWDVRTGSTRRSENSVQILGLESQRTFTSTQFLARVHPDDRARFKACVCNVRPDCPSYAVTFRFIRPNGREMWLEETATAEFDATGRYVRLKGLTLDITERKRAEERQGLLIAELDHRVKNVLARVGVVAMYTRQSSRSMEEFVEALDGRIQSMANAHGLLSQSRWHGVGLAELVGRQLAPYATAANTTISGPDITLNVETTEALAMVLQELATNAAKYGALSTQGGRVSVNWDRRRSGDMRRSVVIGWREIGEAPIAIPTLSGYGTSLIRDLIPHELGGTVDLAFPSSGVRCTIEIPLTRDDHKEDPLTELRSQGARPPEVAPR